MKLNRVIIYMCAVVSMCSCATSLHQAQTDCDIDIEEADSCCGVSRSSLPELKPDFVALDMDVAVEEPMSYKELREPIEPFSYDQRRSVMITEFRELVTFEDLEIDLNDYKDEFHYPADGYITSPFGWRGIRMHNGVDIKAKRGDNLYSVFDGVVRYAKYNGAYGYCIVVRHYNGLETLYAHASKILVKENQEVSSGDVIALAGRTGRATGDHLHFEVRVAGQCIDPSLVVDTRHKTLQEKNLYVTMSSGTIYGSNSDLASVRAAEIKEASSIKYHIVRSGDTLSQIALNNHTTVSRICLLNKISSRSIIKLNQRLRVR